MATSFAQPGFNGTALAAVVHSVLSQLGANSLNSFFGIQAGGAASEVAGDATAVSPAFRAAELIMETDVQCFLPQAVPAVVLSSGVGEVSAMHHQFLGLLQILHGKHAALVERPPPNPLCTSEASMPMPTAHAKASPRGRSPNPRAPAALQDISAVSSTSAESSVETTGTGVVGGVVTTPPITTEQSNETQSGRGRHSARHSAQWFSTEW